MDGASAISGCTIGMAGSGRDATTKRPAWGEENEQWVERRSMAFAPLRRTSVQSSLKDTLYRISEPLNA